ncbi:MAG TPA: fibronectin type III domain-containing protein [Acidimicrobiia bacterium]|nr:fibronectin type III domain-containing protein [Acidimicrobiia bacterium]
MRRSTPRRAVLLAATLALSTIAPGFFAPARATDLAILQGSIHSVAGDPIPADVSLLAAEDGTTLHTVPSDGDSFGFHSEGGPHIFRFAAPSTAQPTPAPMPATWSFDAPYLVQGDDLDIDVTLPGAVTADIVVLGANDQPVSARTMTYSAFTDNVDLGAGLIAQAVAEDTVGDADGHFTPLLFGPATFTFTLSDGSTGGPVTVRPGDRATIQLSRPSAPQNVTATAGDGKVKVTWDPPVSDGGSPITGYIITASRNSSNFKASYGPDATSGVIRSLVNGKTYSVTVVAKNANGTGAASPPISVSLPAVDPPPTTTTTTAPPADGDPLGGAGSGDDGPGTAAGSRKAGYWLLDATGVVYPFGDAAPYGDPAAKLAAASVPGSALRAVDLEPTPSMKGYWVLDSRGRIHPFGDAPHLGDVAPGRLSAGEEPATLSATPSGAGYWVFTNRGQAIAFGDAAVLGDMTGTTLNGPVLDSVATPSGQGYYMVASDGGIFAFGDARFAGSMGGQRLNAPVRSLVPDGDGTGYWLVAADGGVFAFDAPFVGSMGGRPLNKPVQGMVRYGNGYLMVAEDGGVFTFSDLPFTGSLGGRPPTSPIVSVAALA